METDRDDDELVEGYLARLSGHAWGTALGVLLAIGLFGATNILVLKGGEDVGTNLGLLSQYLPLYDVEFFPGSFVGAAYFLVLGYLVGRLVCFVYNRTSH